MQFRGEALVLAVRAHGEHGAIVRALTRDHGVQPGYVRGGHSRRLRPVLQPGNRVIGEWRARTEEQLPALTVELVNSLAPLHAEPLPAAALDWLTVLTVAALPEGQAFPALFDTLEAVLAAVEAAPAARGWAAALARYELLLLAELGFGLDLSRCAATGTTDDLDWVSPKSGGAVSRAAAAGYEARLFPLPAFLRAGGEADWPDILAALAITGHFLARDVLTDRQAEVLVARARLVDRLKRVVREARHARKAGARKGDHRLTLIAILPGDGIGPEVTHGARRVLEALGLGLGFEEALVGGAAYHATGHPLPPETLDLARRADAILFGAVGDPSCDALPRALRPEQAILGLRKELTLFANLRPAKMFAGLEDASALKPEVAGAIDLLIVRELNGDVYFGEKGLRTTPAGLRQGYDVMSYDEAEVRRIAHAGFQAAAKRRGRLCSVDKANVLETSQLWRDVVIEVAAEYQQVALSHMYVDNAAMQLVRNPGQFDVIVTGNLFGDILSDQASMCVGSIGLLPSASLDVGGKGLYEPIHGSAPDIARQGKANPCAAILSAAMMLRYSLGEAGAADRIEAAVARALATGARTADLGGALSTEAMTDAVLAALA